jgi:hypothetical protein
MTDQRHAIIDIKFSSSKPEREGIAILSSRREDRRPAAWYCCKALARFWMKTGYSNSTVLNSAGGMLRPAPRSAGWFR